MTPYLYGKSRHVRSNNPGLLRKYSAYKPFLRKEFDSKCVYCRSPSTWANGDTFGVDHYRPQSLFPHLGCEYSNLYYCCNRCNRFKGNFWTEGVDFIPNPCDHVMFDHLRFEGPEVKHKTRAGAATVERLDLNDPEWLRFRADVLQLIELADAERRKLKSLALQELDPEEAAAVQVQLDKVERLIGRLMGLDEATP